MKILINNNKRRKKMYDVIVDGIKVARAETKQDEEIYKLCFLGVDEKEISELLNIPLESVTRLTDSGKYR